MFKKVKYILLLSSIVFLLTGCCYVNNSSIDTITNQILNSKRKMYNKNTVGYKYYLPRNMASVEKDEYNNILRDSNYTYYMYTDLVSYYNKKKTDYTKEQNYYSRTLENGIINIEEQEENYLIKVVYNYVSVEVVCKKVDLKNVLSNVLVIVKSVKYNNDAVKLLISSGNKNGNEEVIDIFHKDKVNNDYLEYDDTYTGDEEADYDPDVIN